MASIKTESEALQRTRHPERRLNKNQDLEEHGSPITATCLTLLGASSRTACEAAFFAPGEASKPGMAALRPSSHFMFSCGRHETGAAVRGLDSDESS